MSAPTRSLLFLFQLTVISLGTSLEVRANPEPASTRDTVRTGPAPAWVKPTALGPIPRRKPTRDGIAYELREEQENVGAQEKYFHLVRQITSESGLQLGAKVDTSYDPEFETLTFHFIRVCRGGNWEERLDRSKIHLYQREEEMENFLYDGSYTAQCQLEDVRVGDIVEYAYTRHGANPVLGGKYFETFQTEWALPLHRGLLRLVYPASRQIRAALRNREIHPIVTSQGGESEWLWDEREIPARELDERVPTGYWPLGAVQFTEFADWQEVASWAASLYNIEAPLTEALQAEITRLGAIADARERVSAALRFVQDEIRYLGIEAGVGSHRPTPPGEVLRRRFGDCKDKTLLLATLLRHSGIKATPALVNSRVRLSLADRLPSAGLFDHVILQVQLGEQTHWLDATRGFQRGPLSQIAITDFGYALLVDPATKALTPCAPPSASLPRKHITETYFVARPPLPGRLEVVTEYRGSYAEGVREDFVTDDRERIQKQYLKFYARQHPQIEVERAMEYRELPGGEGCEVKEFYSVPDLWKRNEEKAGYRIDVYPWDFASILAQPPGTKRKDPLELPHPLDVTEEIVMRMFENWNMTADSQEERNDFFHSKQRGAGEGSVIRLTYSLQTLTDRVPAQKVAGYDASLRKAKDALGYNFTWQAPTALTSKASPGHGQFNWPMALLLGTIVMGGGVGSYQFYRYSKLPGIRPPSLTHPQLEGIGGWLILVAFGLFLRPFVYGASAAQLAPSIFDLERWLALTHEGAAEYHPFWMPALLYEAVFNSLAVVFSVLLIFLFLKKRAVWPRCFAFYFIFLLVGVTVDEVLALQLSRKLWEPTSGAGQLAQVFISACIWIPYAFVSKRVKATFRY